MAAEFDPYHKWLGILPKDQPPHHYRLLAIELFEDDLQVIEAASDRQLSFLRKYQSGEYAAQCQKLLNEVSRARLCLLKPATKTAYDAELRQKLEPEDVFSDIIDDTSDDPPPLPRSTRKKAPTSSGNQNWAGQEFLLPAAFGGGLLILAIVVFALFRGRAAKPPVVDAQEHSQPVQAAPAKPIEPQAEATPEVTTDSKPQEPAGDEKTINILPLLKPEHSVVGEWKIAPNRLETVGYTVARQIRLPVEVPREYTVHVRGTRLATAEGRTVILGLILVYGNARTIFVMDVYADAGSSGFHMLDGESWGRNSTSLSGFLTKIDQPFDLDAIVRQDGIEIRFDGRTVVDWKGNPEQLSLGLDWRDSADGQLVLAAEPQYVITELTIGPPSPRR